MLKLKPRRRKETTRAIWTISGKGPDGVVYRESLGAYSRSEAEVAFERRRGEIYAHAARSGASDDLPVADLIVYYLDTPDPETGRAHDPRFTDVIVRHLGERRVSELSAPGIHDVARIAYPAAKASTVNRQFIAPLSAAIRFCHDRGRCPLLAVPRLAESRPPERVAADQRWIEAFCRAAVELRHPRLAAMELLMATTGARRGSCIELQWADVDISGRTATLRDTKSGDDVTAYLADGMVSALESIRGDDGSVFGIQRDTHGKPLRSFYRRWRAICVHAGIAYIPPHQSGRHTFATEMIVRRGVDAFTTAALAGWRSPKMLERYVHAKGARHVVDAAFADLPQLPAAKNQLHHLCTKGEKDE